MNEWVLSEVLPQSALDMLMDEHDATPDLRFVTAPRTLTAVERADIHIGAYAEFMMALEDLYRGVEP